MDNQDTSRRPEEPNVEPVDTDWLDSLLGPETLPPEIGPDEQAMAAAGLIDPEDLELERILAEARAENQAGEPQPEGTAEPAADPDATILFAQEDALRIAGAEPAPAHESTPMEEESSVEDNNDFDAELLPPDPPRKRRPGHKKGYGLLGIPHILATVIWIAIAIAIGTTLGRVMWLCAVDILAFDQVPQTLTITITEEDDLDSIAQQLQDLGLIKYPELFKFFANLTGKVEKISAGTYILNALVEESDGTLTFPGIVYDYNALLNAMRASSPTREVVKVVIPEGYTSAQIFALLERSGVCTVEELEAYAAEGELKEYWFLEGVPRGDRYCLEGYLFPDTYEFYTNDDPQRVLQKLLNAFDARFTDKMKESLTEIQAQYAADLASRGYGQSYIDEHPLTIRQIVIIASMIEEESANDSESYDISSVIYNRLTNPGNFPYLNIDAALIYALDGNIDPETGRTMPLTNEDKQLDSPYNTYLYAGLIPGPISNPGRNSLNAALTPSDTDYYYYVYYATAGSSLFAETLEEHQANIDRVNAGS